MLDVIKPLVAATLMPLPLAGFLVLLGGLLLLVGRRLLGRFLVLLALVVVFAASWAPVADRLLGPLEQTYGPVQDPTAYADVSAVVVLGAAWEPDMPAPASIQLNDSASHRLLEGLRLIGALPEARLVASGGTRELGRLAMALGYARAAQELGVDPARIVVLDTPRDTVQEAYAVRDALAEGERFFLVTSASHMPRSVRHFQRAGLEPIPAPTRFKTGRQSSNPLAYWLPSASELRKTERALYEYLGLLALELDHRARP
jgi:uncharacterized SAM-binding protein YcdF (DUF218 family)